MNQVFYSLFGTEIKLKFRLPLVNCKKAMILAPHPDDESLGCGGTVRLLSENSCNVSIVLMTDGKDKSLGQDLSKVRMDEFNSAISLLGCNKTICLGFPDGDLSLYVADAAEKLSKILVSEEPEIIFLPYILDFNPDHRYLNLILSMSLGKNRNIYIAMYEVWTPIIYPDCYVDVTKEYDKKLAAIRCYSSQEEHYKIADKAKLLNGLRAKLSMRRNVIYIEAFKTFTNEDYCNIIRGLAKIGWFEK